MATDKKTSGSKQKVATAKPVLGSMAAARPAALPFAKAPPEAPTTGDAAGIIKQVDPLFVYDIRVFTGTEWLKLGEIWFNTAGVEYWGLYQAWATYNVAPNCWIYPIASATTYSSLADFKAKITTQDPAHNPSFLKITQTAA